MENNFLTERFCLDNFLPNTVDNFDKLPKRCKEIFFQILHPDCPYHRLFSDGFMQTYMKAFDFDYSGCKTEAEIVFYFCHEILLCNFPIKHSGISIKKHPEIIANDKKYDFAFCFENGTPNKLLVECNGYDTFNSKGKKPDSKRDKEIKDLGYEIITYSEYQIIENPFQCVMRATDTFINNQKINQRR